MAFGSIVFTTRGKVLQSKAQAGTKLNFTKLAIGDGELGSQSVLELTDLKNKKLDIPISALKVLTGGIASVGGTFTNENIDTGFYWREVGLYATDPDIGEILYVYGNAGALAEYIPSSGGSEILEKFVAIEAIIGNANNVSATINQSLVYATIEDIETHNSDSKAHPELSQQIKNLESQIQNIDVSGDIRQVINERVNADTSKPLSTLISEWVNAAKTAILNSINELPQKSVWSDERGAKLDNLNQSMTTTQTNITNVVNAARDNIKTHVTSALSSISAKVGTYNLHATNVLANLSTNQTASSGYKYLGKFLPLYDGTIYLCYRITNTQSQAGEINIATPHNTTKTSGNVPFTNGGAINLDKLAVGTTVENNQMTGLSSQRSLDIIHPVDLTTEVTVPLVVHRGIPIYVFAHAYNTADANKLVVSYIKILGSVVQA